MHSRFTRNMWRAFFALFVTIAPLGAVQATEPVRIPQADASAILSSVLSRGQELEGSQQWGAALGHYEEALREHPEHPTLLERYDSAKLHFSFDRRYGDESFRSLVDRLNPQTAAQVYQELLAHVDSHFVTTPNWNQLIDRGIRALEIAAQNDEFLRRNAPGRNAPRPGYLTAEARRLVGTKPLRSYYQTVSTASSIARMARMHAGITEAATMMEFAAAAAGGLDEYSAFLTPGQLGDQMSQIEGNFVGLGIELKAGAQGLEIVHVIPNSPAEKAGILSGDFITEVDGQATTEVSTDRAASILAGEEGTVARVKVVTGTNTPRTLTVRREHVVVPSIEDASIVDSGYGIAYARIPAFQKSTAIDLDSTLWDLHGKGMRSLILDLRGNPGGLLNVSIEVADKFVYDGRIVSTRGRNPGENFDFNAKRVGTWRVPLIVLVDGDSASASEIFAGAIRDHQRGTIMGEKTYGKGSVQGIFQLTSAPVGLRLTTAKFYSPSGQTIHKRGVSPTTKSHIAARPTEAGTPPRRVTPDTDPLLNAAIQTARQQMAVRQ